MGRNVNPPVFYDQVTGAPARVGSVIVKRLSAYTRTTNVRRFKIGISNNPDRRFQEAYEGFYDEMVVLYETTSIDYVSELERILVAYNLDYTDNEVAGGGGGIGEPPYYLYVVVQHWRS